MTAEWALTLDVLGFRLSRVSAVRHGCLVKNSCERLPKFMVKSTPPCMAIQSSVTLPLASSKAFTWWKQKKGPHSSATCFRLPASQRSWPDHLLMIELPDMMHITAVKQQRKSPLLFCGFEPSPAQ